jgi:hypothetical protein
MALMGNSLLNHCFSFPTLTLHAGADPGEGCIRRAPPPKIGKNKIFLAKNRDFSHEIPQTFSRLPPQLEKI